MKIDDTSSYPTTRRAFLGALTAGTFAGCGALRALCSERLRESDMSCIVLWMQGGPSQFESFDPKPEHSNGGPTGVQSTSVPGIQVAEHWPLTAKAMKHIAVIRSMTNREGNHLRAEYQLHTGYAPTGGVRHPALGALVAKELRCSELDLPAYVATGRLRRRSGLGAGFLGVEHNPFVIPRPGARPQNVELPVSEERLKRRLNLLGELEQKFAVEQSAQSLVAEREGLYGRGSRLALSPRLEAFDLERESERTRDDYGRNDFGNGCLLARRLVEAGVTFVEVRSGGWDTHTNNFERVATLSGEVDRGFSTLIGDLQARGLLQRTLLVWMGEFGRTPRINPRAGRDHFPRAFSVALAGGGVRGGQVIGATTPDGTRVRERPVVVSDLFATIFHCLGLNPAVENESTLGRPIKAVDGGRAISELFA